MDLAQTEAGLLLLGVLFLILGLGVWIGLGLLMTGLVGVVAMPLLMSGMASFPADKVLGSAVWGSLASWTLAALPLFIWMGEILFRTRLSDDMFRGLSPWVQWLPGRLMHVNVIGCGIFAAVSGSSAATAATIGKMSLPALTRRGYHQPLAIGSLAGAGTLGLLIPPSIVMIVYGVAAEVSIVRLFIAGLVPGLLLMLLFSGYIAIWSLLNPKLVPPADPPMPLRQKLRASGQLIPVLLLIGFVMGSIYFGWATATEAAAFGVAGALALSAFGGTLTRKSFADSLMGAVKLSCMINLILAGAAFLTKAMAYSGIPAAMATWVGSQGFSPLHDHRRADADLPRARLLHRRHQHDRADGQRRAADHRADRLRPDLVRHLRGAGGGDGADHASGRLQPVRAAGADGAGDDDGGPKHAALLLPAGGGGGAGDAVSGTGDLPAQHDDGQLSRT
jgi:C4-dicarboxylate transporter DctM subunit